MATIELWACVTCGTTVATAHCPDCGESVIRARDLGLRQLLVEAFHAVTDVDSRLIRSIRTLVFHPGALTTAYLEGPRKHYIYSLSRCMERDDHPHLFAITSDKE